jgi:uncharacterized cupin superfamily protein
MNPKLMFAIVCLFSCLTVLGQTVTNNPLQPILLDKSALSGVDLRKIDLKKEPEKDFYQRSLYRGEDISVYVVSTETWNNEIENYAFDEYVYLLHGQSIVKPTVGASKIFSYGDHFFMPKNFKGEWEIHAGENLHYELSVITTRRTDSTTISDDVSYQAIDHSLLSGNQISFKEDEGYVELIRRGVELQITLTAEKPREKVFQEPMKEQLIHLLSGSILFIDSEKETHQYYTGDFFVIPKNLTGTWISKGHGLVKYLVIEKTDL